MTTGFNEYGTAISFHRCDVCGRSFTVCPPREGSTGGGTCLAVDCASYDVTRDVDLFWDSLPIRRIPL